MTELETTRRTETPPAAAPADLDIQLVQSEAEARAVVRVLAQVWSRDGDLEPLPPELAWVFAHSGNYVAAARVGDEPVAAAIGFYGNDSAGPHLHSHIAGVLPAWQGSNVGYLLKQHQRSWAVDRGLNRITWTFDPLVARNAYFNVVKLGARLTHYYVDFYGPMPDDINSGDETDRCLVSWRLDSAVAGAAAAGRFAAADLDDLRARGAVQVLGPDASGAPVQAQVTAPTRLVQVPRDIVGLRRSAPALARRWRLALRDVLVRAFADGLEVVAVTRDSCYVVSAPRD
jgi:predicted GNAT superfamily acetyltransferase